MTYDSPSFQGTNPSLETLLCQTAFNTSDTNNNICVGFIFAIF